MWVYIYIYIFSSLNIGHMMATGNMKLWNHFRFPCSGRMLWLLLQKTWPQLYMQLHSFFPVLSSYFIFHHSNSEGESMFCLILYLIYFMIFKNFFFKMAIILKLPQVNYLDSQRNLFVLDIGFVVGIICSQFRFSIYQIWDRGPFT